MLIKIRHVLPTSEKNVPKTTAKDVHAQVDGQLKKRRLQIKASTNDTEYNNCNHSRKHQLQNNLVNT